RRPRKGRDHIRTTLIPSLQFRVNLLYWRTIENLTYEFAAMLRFHRRLLNPGEEIELLFAPILDVERAQATAKRIIRHVHGFEEAFLRNLQATEEETVR
ncbi:MAG: hypothetical protein ABSH26_18230, partial [Opitutaceae bacterium]